MSDKNAVLTAADGTTFYFPAASVSRVLAKNNTVISLPSKVKGFDRLIFTDKFRLVGNWHDDLAGEYDSKTAFSRLDRLMVIVTTDNRPMSFVWKSTSRISGTVETSGPHQVMISGANFDKNGGEGTMIPYVLEIDRITG